MILGNTDLSRLGAASRDERMIRTQLDLVNRQGLVQEFLRLGRLALQGIQPSQRFNRGGGLRIPIAERLLANLKSTLQQRLGLGILLLVNIKSGEVVQRRARFTASASPAFSRMARAFLYEASASPSSPSR